MGLPDLTDDQLDAEHERRRASLVAAQGAKAPARERATLLDRLSDTANEHRRRVRLGLRAAEAST